jgi:hypothetical protein
MAANLVASTVVSLVWKKGILEAELMAGWLVILSAGLMVQRMVAAKVSITVAWKVG